MVAIFGDVETETETGPVDGVDKGDIVEDVIATCIGADSSCDCDSTGTGNSETELRFFAEFPDFEFGLGDTGSDGLKLSLSLSFCLFGKEACCHFFPILLD